eukprot:TRINITY_DN768_c0_g1_i1.p1 TRINITY_DN768_c0_g1~~TRINITY_DN768_c0_g1_i1.p1  ORF type:complete len:109 (+),score=18.61 TRINITY_DN768_c0_g1_i1:346-672(+)
MTSEVLTHLLPIIEKKVFSLSKNISLFKNGLNSDAPSVSWRIPKRLTPNLSRSGLMEANPSASSRHRDHPGLRVIINTAGFSFHRSLAGKVSPAKSPSILHREIPFSC